MSFLVRLENKRKLAEYRSQSKDGCVTLAMMELAASVLPNMRLPSSEAFRKVLPQSPYGGVDNRACIRVAVDFAEYFGRGVESVWVSSAHPESEYVPSGRAVTHVSPNLPAIHPPAVVFYKTPGGNPTEYHANAVVEGSNEHQFLIDLGFSPRAVVQYGKKAKK